MDQETMGDVDSRNKSLGDVVKQMCSRAGISYRSPRKFRRCHGVYAVKHSSNFEEFQAYSQNMGHKDPGTTFKYYASYHTIILERLFLINDDLSLLWI